MTQRKIEFRLVVEAQEMLVTFHPSGSSGKLALGVFEFRSPYDPPRPIIVSQTGYRVRVELMADIKASASLEDYARQIVRDIIDDDKKCKSPESEQEPLAHL